MHWPREDSWVLPASPLLSWPISGHGLVTSTCLFSAFLLTLGSPLSTASLHLTRAFNRQAHKSSCLLPPILTGMRQGTNVQFNKNPLVRQSIILKLTLTCPILPSPLVVQKFLKPHLLCDGFLNNRWHHVPCF